MIYYIWNLLNLHLESIRTFLIIFPSNQIISLQKMLFFIKNVNNKRNVEAWLGSLWSVRLVFGLVAESNVLTNVNLSTLPFTSSVEQLRRFVKNGYFLWVETSISTKSSKFFCVVLFGCLLSNENAPHAVLMSP